MDKSSRPHFLVLASLPARGGWGPERGRGWVGKACGLEGRLRDSRNLGAERLELLFDALVSAVEVVNAIDDALPLGGERGEHQTGAGPEVRRHHFGPGERRG